MARVKLSEFRVKSLLVGDDYRGVSLRLETLDDDIAKLAEETRYIVKVDQGIKKRGKQGLIRLNVTKSEAAPTVHELAAKGFTRFIAEPMFPHEDSEERYVSFERTREGIAILYSKQGGVNIEESPESVQKFTPETVPLPREFVDHIIRVMNTEHFSFVEINPLIVHGNDCILLDAAALADSAGVSQANWSDDDIVEARTPTEAEAAVATLNDNSPAAFTFRILNPNGAIWLLLSGGGASITIADEAMNQGKAELIGNYGEYSGNPNKEETYLYAKQVLQLLVNSEASKKVLMIGGGTANFTDISKTFQGIVQALTELSDQLKKQNVSIYVRRGGPNYRQGLKSISEFLLSANLRFMVFGPEKPIAQLVRDISEELHA